MRAMSRWKLAIFAAGSFFCQLKLGEQLYASIFPGNSRWIASAKRSASARFGSLVSHHSRSAYGA